MSGFDPYQTLGVSKNASQEEIKKAYRKLARKYHPDHNPGDKSAEVKFKELKKAYDIIGDANRREQYDNYGFTGDEQQAGGFGGFDGGFGVNFEDIFESMFGQGFGGQGGRQRPQRGADLRMDLSLSFEEAAFGTEKEVSYHVYTVCSDCHGSGARPGTSRQQCSECKGSGQVRVVKNTLLGRMVQVQTCPSCSGQGSVIKENCPNCRGQGRVETQLRKKIKIPAGVDNGSRIRVSGGGHAGHQGAPAGDLYLVVSVRPHEYFTRKGQDVHLDVPIGLAQAALGVELDVPTLDGVQRLNIPPGTQSGDSFRIRGKGIPAVNRNIRGDQLVKVRIDVPKRLSPEAREALRTYAKYSGETIENVDGDILTRIKRAFGRR
ncbi:MAG: molecular chaperone DnaJ [Firmicutes bacterium]|nr:molecular chaperone DnaJ [Bacillota bacterium]